MAQQKALILPKPLGSFEVGEKPIPSPGPGDLLVRVESAGLQPLEWKIQKNEHGLSKFAEPYPAVLGVDIAGTVEAVGEGVTRFAKGDRVLTQGHVVPDKAGFQQYTLADTDFTTKIPVGLSFDEASTLPSSAISAAFGLYNPLPRGAGLTPPWEAGGREKHAGKPILIFGGSSSVGQLVIQFAKLSGLSPIITTASPHNAPLLKSLGATHVVDRSLSPAAAIAGITSAPLTLIYDAVSFGETQHAAWRLLAPGGVLVVTLPPVFDVEEGKSEGKTAMQVFGIAHAPLPGQRESAKTFFAALEDLLKKGEIKPNPVRVLPGGLNAIPEGLQELEEGRVSGQKLVVHPHETQ
ncbi:GroES-like protein [Gloeophyllum trabeum ATCC 11539]|uniref:GroES-like protein n=1 Tax=Gloeophyllum trabeum (strain ATCC 11539 / FP-39264 / Madison 617) TaxID=670483 RepID=S7PUK2_GLOTA|nr:GroES-like protein [Gloeophyllum trabeum ATCC 11539]EPQ51058.1 GroES-like protein [Gloeophyllum trabeum ATCC 11539]